jgi:hypothetical protein
MKILELCKQKIENRIPRTRVDRGWAEAEWHYAITPCGGTCGRLLHVTLLRYKLGRYKKLVMTFRHQPTSDGRICTHVRCCELASTDFVD